MKLARWLLLGIGSLVLVIVVLTVTILLPPVQKWAVQRVANSQPGIQLTLGSVAAGPSSFRLNQVEFARDGMVVRAGEISGKYSLWAFLSSRRVEVKHLSLHGLAVDLSHLPAARPATAPTTTAAPVAFAGVFSNLQLPLTVQLDACEIDGTVLLSGLAGKPPVQAEYTLTGNQFGPGRDATFVINARLTNPQPQTVSTLRIAATLQAVQTEQRTFQSLGLTAVIDAEGPALTEKTQLRLESRLAQPTPGRETYTAKVDTLAGGKASNVLDATAEFSAATKAVEGIWTLKASRAQVDPFLLGAPLPEFAASGSGRFRYETGIQRVALTGSRVSAVVEHLGVLFPPLESLGSLNVQADFDCAYAFPSIRLDRLDLVVSSSRPVLETRMSRSLQFDLDKREFHFDGGPGEVLRIKLLGVPVAWAGPFVSGLVLADGSLTGEIACLAEGKNLRAQTAAPLKLTGLEFGGTNPPLDGKTDLSLHFDALATPERINATVRDFRVATAKGDTVNARAEIVLPTGAAPPISVQAKIDADLPQLLAALVPLDRLRVQAAADITLQGQRVDVRALTADATANGVPILAASTLQAFSFDLALQRATPANTAKPDLLRIVLGRIPLQPFAAAFKGLRLDGEVSQGEFLLGADGDKLLFASPKPLKLTDVTIAKDGQLMLKQIETEANPSGEFGQAGLKFNSGPLTIRNSVGATLLSAQAEGAALSPSAETRLNSSFQLDLPIALTQPIFAGAAAVSQGRASGELRALLSPGATQVEARATINGLVAKSLGEPLPVANLSLRAVTNPAGTVSIQMPVLLDNGGQRSDLNLTVDIKPTDSGHAFDARLTSSSVEVADVRTLAGIFATADDGAALPSASEKPVAISVADPRPAWAGWVGQIALDLKSVAYGKQWAMSGFTGLLKIDDARLKLEKLNATIDEKSQLEAAAELRFVPKEERPYKLDGRFAVNDFDAGRFFRALEASKTPTIEGLFSVNGVVGGDGLNLSELTERTRGEFDLTSRKGIFRGLARTTSKVSTATKAVQLGAALGALLGSEAVAKSAENVAGGAYFVDELAKSLGEFAYDQLSVKLSRDESLNLKLENVSLISQEVRLAGSGRLTYAKGVPLLQQKLNVDLVLTGRGKIEQILGKLGALDGTRDDLGYARMKFPVTITGTPGKPDPSKFYAAFATSGLFNLLGR
ncbi:MAG: AsmA-like C-terminal region-containing protein [Opitutaceae bacterium]|nr:AsmA-like C-terminal region-containing protein [Opitutaceae bacterium]